MFVQINLIYCKKDTPNKPHFATINYQLTTTFISILRIILESHPTPFCFTRKAQSFLMFPPSQLFAFGRNRKRIRLEPNNPTSGEELLCFYLYTYTSPSLIIGTISYL